MRSKTCRHHDSHLRQIRAPRSPPPQPKPRTNRPTRSDNPRIPNREPSQVKDLLIVYGRNHCPDDIEATIEEIGRETHGGQRISFHR
jgi:hypothetical protein